MQVTWVMQTNMGSQSDILSYVSGIKASGANVVEVDYIPFSGVLPEIEVSGPVIFYGSVGFIRTAQESGKWPLGIFADIETFTYENWAKHYSGMLLNSPDSTELMTIGTFSLENRNSEDDIFVRPQHDTKSLVGTVMTAGEFHAWCSEAKKEVFADVTGDTPIIVAKPYGIEAEWRLFVVDHEIVAASKYHQRKRLCKESGAPQNVLDFANEAIAKWSPVRAYVLDICTSAGNCYIVEAQGFNSAGIYAADPKKIALAVNDVAIDMWNKKKLKLG